ncbi:hypothetical protein [Streptomyces niveus]|uniref:hypothetical protein n=1 Tax=Streptomyces niveus TaxID=193462 RepID=UPI0036D23F81
MSRGGLRQHRLLATVHARRGDGAVCSLSRRLDNAGVCWQQPGDGMVLNDGRGAATSLRHLFSSSARISIDDGLLFFNCHLFKYAESGYCIQFVSGSINSGVIMSLLAYRHEIKKTSVDVTWEDQWFSRSGSATISYSAIISFCDGLWIVTLGVS